MFPNRHQCHISKTCPVCGQTFSGRPSEIKLRKYCSPQCANTDLRGKPKKEGIHEITCQICGKQFHIDPYRASTAKFCSRECARLGKLRIARKRCEHCGAFFEGKPSIVTNSKYCSQECRNEVQSLKRKGQQRAPRAVCYCRICGKKFEILASHAKYGHGKYCSKTCLALGRNQTAFIDAPTSIEKLMHQELDHRKIKYEKQYPHNRFLIDIAIPDALLAIECDGTYWHNRPGNATKDKRKNTTLRRAGWTILRFTEDEIRASPQRCVDIIERHLKKR